MWHQCFPGASLGASWIDLDKPTIATKAARNLTEALSVVVSSKAVCRLRPIRCAMPSIVSRWLVLASRVYSGPIRYTRPDHRLRTEAFRLSMLRAPVRSLARIIHVAPRKCPHDWFQPVCSQRIPVSAMTHFGETVCFL